MDTFTGANDTLLYRNDSKSMIDWEIPSNESDDVAILSLFEDEFN